MKINYNNKTLEVQIERYVFTDATGLVAFNEDGEVYGHITVNTGIPMLEYWITIDTNNYPNIDNALMEAGIIDDELITYACSGFCSYPVYAFTETVCATELAKIEL